MSKSEMIDSLKEQRMRSINADINRAVDMVSLNTALKRLETLGMGTAISRHAATLAESLRVLLREENQKLHRSK